MPETMHVEIVNGVSYSMNDFVSALKKIVMAADLINISMYETSLYNYFK